MKKIFILLMLLVPLIRLAGQDTLNQTDPHGRKHGSWIKRDSAGNKIYEGQFDHGVPYGEFRYFYPNGAKKTVSNISQQGKRARTVSWFPNGKLMAKGNYLNEKRDSIWQYFSDITEQIISEECYSNGNLNGPSKVFYPNGAVSEIKNYTNGIANGTWEMYFDDGNLKLKGNFLNGEKDGNYRIYSPDGQLLVKGKYYNGHQDGDWFYYDEKGAIRQQDFFNKGQLVRTTATPER